MEENAERYKVRVAQLCGCRVVAAWACFAPSWPADGHTGQQQRLRGLLQAAPCTHPATARHHARTPGAARATRFMSRVCLPVMPCHTCVRVQLFMKRLELCDDPAAQEYLRYTNAQMLNGGFSYGAMFEG